MNWMVFRRQFRRAGPPPAAELLAALLTAALWTAPVVCAARPHDTAGLRRQASAVQGTPRPETSGWAFGVDTQAARWRQGISGAELQHKAVAGRGRTSAVASQTGDAGRGDDGRVRSSSGPDRVSSGVALSWERDITTWQPETPTRIRQAGEVFSLHQRHIVRAQARAGDRNASVSVGPEVIIKDDNEKALAKDPHSPDSAIGFGMRFMVGF